MIPQLTNLIDWLQHLQLDAEFSQATTSLLFQYGITAVGLLGCLGLWMFSARDIRKVQSALSETRKSADAGMRQLADRLEEVRTVMNTEPQPVAAPVTGSLNLTRRAQALRMHNRGETMASISAALQAPLNEIELLLKLNRIIDSRLQ